MTTRVRAIVPCRLEFRDGVGGLVQCLCEGVADEVMYQVVSAFNEAFNNVVHHSRLQGDAAVEVEALREPSSVTVRLVDDGIAYEVDLHPSEDLHDDLREEGMGLLIISRCMDEVRYERGARNVFTMVKHLAVSEQATER